MPHNRTPKKGSRWYLPEKEYRYVVAFCLTYKDLKRKLDNMSPVHSPNMDGMPHSQNVSDPTAQEAMERMKIQRKIDIIENTVMEVCPELYRPMMMAITRDDIPLWRIRMDFDYEMSEKKFSILRRKVYYKISKSV